MRAQEPSAEEGFMSIIWLIMLLKMLKRNLIMVFLCFIAVKSQAPDKAPAANGSSFNQLLGIKGAAQESVSLQCRVLLYSREPGKKIILQLILRGC